MDGLASPIHDADGLPAQKPSQQPIFSDTAIPFCLNRDRAGAAKSYAERLFDYPEMGPLAEADASDTIVKPALEEGVKFAQDAVRLILQQTHGYPYFLQEWGKHAWDVASASPITEQDVRGQQRRHSRLG